METRKVQKVGYSTLLISLPRAWVRESKIRQGDILALEQIDDGSLRVYPESRLRESNITASIVNANLCTGKGMLLRVITGCYIVGQDTIKVIASNDLKRDQLDEIRLATQLLTGLDIVEQTLKSVVLQSFIDPTKFPIDGLIRRLHTIACSMLQMGMRALFDRKYELAEEARRLEDEADRLYWLIIRQILVSLRDRETASKIGFRSPLEIPGDRVVAKSLEEMADYSDAIASEVLRFRGMQANLPGSILKEVRLFHERVSAIAEKSIKPLFDLDIRGANDIIEAAEAINTGERRLLETIVKQVRNVSVAVGLRSIVWSLRHIGEYSDIISEVAINRAIRQSTEICKPEGA